MRNTEYGTTEYWNIYRMAGNAICTSNCCLHTVSQLLATFSSVAVPKSFKHLKKYDRESSKPVCFLLNVS